MEGYKVFKSNNKGEMMSCIVEGKARVNYRKGKRNKAPSWLRRINYHLTFFKSLEDAIGFKRCGSLRSAQIWKVRAQSISNVMEKLTVEDLERGIVYRIGIDWPTGTSMAEIIIPVEKVDSNTLERAEGRY